MNATRELLSGPAVAARLGICRHTWHRWVVAQHAPSPVPNVPGHPRWRLTDIEAFERGAFTTNRYFRAGRRAAA